MIDKTDDRALLKKRKACVSHQNNDNDVWASLICKNLSDTSLSSRWFFAQMVRGEELVSLTEGKTGEKGHQSHENEFFYFFLPSF